jgi:uncharacterized membrane protein
MASRRGTLRGAQAQALLFVIVASAYSCRAILGIEDPEPRGDRSSGEAGQNPGPGGAPNGGTTASGGTSASSGASPGGASQAGTSGAASGSAGTATGGDGTGGGGGDDGMDDCMPNPCQNGGTCTDLGSTYECDCGAEYIPPTCALRTFQGIGPSDYGNVALGVSHDGAVVVGAEFDDPVVGSNQHAIRVSPTGTAPMNEPAGALSTTPAAVNADGGIVVGSFAVQTGFRRALGWFQDAVQPLSDPNLTGISQTIALGVSAGGTRAVGYATYNMDRTVGLVWDDTLTAIVLPNPFNVDMYQATAISRDGSIIAGFGQDSDAAPFVIRWRGEPGNATVGITMSPNGQPGQVTTVSDDGNVIGGATFTSNVPSAFRLVGMSYVPIEVPTGVQSTSIRAASADGSIVAGTAVFMNGSHAFIWTEAGGFEFLLDVLTDAGVNTSGWSLRAVNGLSADGRTAVGEGVNTSVQEGFIARLP